MSRSAIRSMLAPTNERAAAAKAPARAQRGRAFVALLDRQTSRAAEAESPELRMPLWSFATTGFGEGQRTPSASAASSLVREVLKTPGQPLDRSARSFFEPRFGHDFGRVRVHADAKAADSARAVDAQAYTVGNRIAFARGSYDPETAHGRNILAHELAHTVQQAGDTKVNELAAINRPHDAFEMEAGRAASILGGSFVSSAGRAAAQPAALLQRYEAYEHAQFGETGDLIAKDVAGRVFSYKVTRGETPKSIAAKFGLTEEQILSANSDKTKHWKAKGDAKKTVTGFNAGETILIPPVLNEITKEALKTKELTFTINGVTLPYGEGIAMGDFYDSPEKMLAAPAAELEGLSKKIKEERAAGKPLSPEEWQKATGGRFLDLAAKNESHFAPSDPKFAPVSGKSSANNKTEWEKDHGAALTESQAGDKDKALATNAFADHFLTDAFAAGHLFNKRDVMEKFESQLPKNAKGDKFAASSEAFFDAISKKAFVGEVKAEFSKFKTVERHFGFRPDINSESRFSALLQGIHMEKPELLEGAIVKGAHDKLNVQGVEVENEKGDSWTLSGDGTLNARSLEVGKKAVAQSQLNIFSVFKKVMALDLPALFKRVWDFVPHPKAGTGETAVKEAVSSGTDPKSAGVIDAVVKLIKDNYKTIIKKLVDMHKLMPA